MEDSVKRGHSSAVDNSPFDKSQNVKNELDDIFAQIGQVNGMVNKIEEKAGNYSSSKKEEEKKVEAPYNIS